MGRISGLCAGKPAQIGFIAGLVRNTSFGTDELIAGLRPNSIERKLFEMKSAHLIFPSMIMLASQTLWLASGARGQSRPLSLLDQGGNLAIEAFDDGFYALRSTAIPEMYCARR